LGENPRHPPATPTPAAASTATGPY